MSRCSKLGVSAAALSATALREVARKCRLPNPQGELLTLARRYERQPITFYLNMPPMTEAKKITAATRSNPATIFLFRVTLRS